MSRAGGRDTWPGRGCCRPGRDTAAVREVALLIIQDHLTAAVEHAVRSGDGENSIKEMIGVLRAAMRQ